MTVHERPVGATVEWYTPPELFDRLGLTFDLDPASPGADKVPWVPARRHYTPTDDGLRQTWQGSVWLNPPYGPQMVPFVKRMIEHGLGLLLIAARTETGAFQQAAHAADTVVFLRDRLHFIRNDGFRSRSSFASALLVFCPTSDKRLRWQVLEADLGWSVLNRPTMSGHKCD